MVQLKVGPQGVRGRVDAGLDLGLVIDLTGAFAGWLGEGPVLLARDTRPSSPMLAHAVLSALCAAGREVLDAGICPTPVAQREAASRGVAGAISITASHNDAHWNGLKLFGAGGRVLTNAEGRDVLDLWHQGDYPRASHLELGALRQLEDVTDRYVDWLCDRVDGEAVAAAGLRVVVDACNGAGAMVVPALCRRLGVELIPVSCEPSGRFPHPPDPSAENMAQAAAIMTPVGAHVGFGLSSDCERVSVITDRGEPLGTPATLPLVLDHVLPRVEGRRVVVSTPAEDSRVEHVAARHQAEVIRNGVGIQAVVEALALEEGAVGGEGSGGVAMADLHLTFDGLGVLARLLEAVARHGASSPLADALPPAHVRSVAIPCPVRRAYSAVARLKASAEGPVTDRDGIRVQLEDAWYYVRVSHTEPVIRLITEAPTPAEADALIARLSRRVRAAVEG